ncbi:hypothetical protein [Gordonia aurantiaca]|uniref:hypothetical protein n=1 Tax=Gordonia sp. B21 TaxID=3151852 RepID=UPI0032644F19
MSNEQFSAPRSEPTGYTPAGSVPASTGLPESTFPETSPTGGPATGTAPGPTVAERANSVVKKVVIGLIIAALLVVTYFILEAFLPRWWAGQIGRRVNGSMASGVWTGLVIGFVCTFLPLLFFTLSFLNRSRLKNIPTIAFAALGVVAAIPNLLTMAVVAGGGNGAHAGERIFDVDAPGFRAASLWGVIFGALVFALVAYFIWRYRRQGRQLAKAKLAK